MTTLSTLPAYPLSGRDAVVLFELYNAGDEAGTYVRVWCTAAPTDSEIDVKLKKDNLSRVVVFEGDAPVESDTRKRARWRHKFDKGGKYTLVLQRYSLPSAWGGGYQDDVRALNTDGNGNATTEKKEGSESTLTLHIAQRIEAPTGAPPDTATLVYVVHDSTIVETTVATHGEATPAITKPATARAKAAGEDASVVTALAALKGVSHATAFGTLSTIISEYRTDLNAHAATGGGVHNATDAVNALLAEYAAGTPTPKTLAEFINDALTKLRRHYLNDSGTGTSSASYHQVGGVKKGDLVNMPLFTAVSSPDIAYVALADIWRAHEGHRASTAVHIGADNTNTLTALPKLLDVHRYVLTFLASSAPTAPPAQSTAATLALAYGFKET